MLMNGQLTPIKSGYTLRGELTMDFNKGMKRAKQIIAKAEQERDRKGYRENLGYDQERKLRDYLSGLDLTYSEQCRILDWFNSACRSI